MKTSIKESKGEMMKKMTMVVPELRAAVVLLALLLCLGATTTAYADFNTGTFNFTVTPDPVLAGGSVTVSFQYRIGHDGPYEESHPNPVFAPYFVYLDGSLVSNYGAGFWHPATASASVVYRTFSVSLNVAIPASATTGTHEIMVKTWANSAGYGGRRTNYRYFWVGPTNQAPVADAGADQTVAQEDPTGTDVTLDGTGSSDPEGGPLTYEWETGGVVIATGEAPTVSLLAGIHTVTLTVTDNGDLYDTDTMTVTVTDNTPPQIIGVYAPVDPVPANTAVAAEADFSDPDTSDTHTATWSWGDGTTSDGIVDEDNQIVYGNHPYSAAGVYTVTLTVTDAAGESDEAGYQYVVVYNPDAGFVTGGGWIDSPAGAYALDPAASGKASFGFVSKYKKGATVPTGNTEFQFKAGDLNFHSTSYDWLVVTGADYANFKGTGEIDGLGSYKFKLWAGDGPDTFRIKIWTEDEYGNETVVYDNVDDQAIGGGNIVVHAK